MKNVKRMLLFAVMTLFGTLIIQAAGLPKIHILATGGTIAGSGSSATNTNYTAGQVAIGSLLDAVPEIQKIADVTGEQIVSIGSQDMNDEVWLTLAKRINDLLAGDCDGIVITHGTDTMEETAYFLNLTVKSDKPVVLTGAMRPSTALSADGPLNLYNAVVTAASADSRGKGVLVAMNGLILGAHSTQKMNTVDVETFQAPNDGALGYIFNGKTYYNVAPLKKHTVNSVFDITNLDKLPKVGIVYSYSNVEADVMDPFLNGGYQGIVHAGVGNGNYHKNLFPKLLEARKKGILVVRSSRVPTGPTTLDGEVDDASYEFVASEELNPQKARVLLMLALTKTKDWKQIQQYFEEY
ncbi:MAG: L-asparaginase 2 [Clostridium sp.]|nr:L-asparaginase 2 [Prevotella sp.]MCM1429340.1 L-asparaginase 2 [Clostridium sp.]MCM1475626.1 L-asparaginase 2 [Muribaculaceae bacterium]